MKNILLVMADGGYLVPPSQDPGKEEMWLETRKRLGRFLPNLFSEIFPDADKEPEKSQPGSAIPSPPKPSSDAGEKSQEKETTPSAEDAKEPTGDAENQSAAGEDFS